MLNIGIFGCTSISAFMLDSLDGLARAGAARPVAIGGVVSLGPDLADRYGFADHRDLRAACEQRGIPIHLVESPSFESGVDRGTIAAMNFDIAFDVGWPNPIPTTILESITRGVYGIHASADMLPRGSGRSTVEWALIEDRRSLEVHLLQRGHRQPGAGVLDRSCVSICAGDDALSLQYKCALAMRRMIARNIESLLDDGPKTRTPRDVAPTHYPKRSPADSLIDWELDVHQIEAFVRALAPPFDAAYSWLDGAEVRICRATLFEVDALEHGFEDVGPGTIVERFPDGKVVLRCVGGLLLVHEFESTKTLRRGDRMVSAPEDIRHFPVNHRGYHDMPPPRSR